MEYNKHLTLDSTRRYNKSVPEASQIHISTLLCAKPTANMYLIEKEDEELFKDT